MSTHRTLRTTRVRNRRRRAALPLGAAILGASAIALTGAPAAIAGPPTGTLLTKTNGIGQFFVRYHGIGGKPIRYGKIEVSLKAETFDASYTRKVITGRGGVSVGKKPTITFRKLSGHDTGDAVLDVSTGGKHPSTISTISLATSDTSWGPLFTVDWGTPGYTFRDFGGDKRFEFVTGDKRFDGAFDAVGESRLPIVIKRASGKSLTDVTTKFADRLQEDADAHRAAWDSATVGSAGARSAVAALVADLARQGKTKEAAAALDAAADRGDFAKAPKFRSTLAADLVSWGYVESAADLG